jgi:hypothetical protein
VNRTLSRSSVAFLDAWRTLIARGTLKGILDTFLSVLRLNFSSVDFQNSFIHGVTQSLTPRLPYKFYLMRYEGVRCYRSGS